jgi:hypothetical protein
MKYGKAAEADRIPAKVLKEEPNVSADMIYPLFLDIWNEVCFPSDWNRVLLLRSQRRGISAIVVTGRV